MLIDNDLQLGPQVKHFLEKNRMTTSVLVELFGFTSQNASAFVRREHISSKYIIPICNYLKITPNQLFRVSSSHTNENDLTGELLRSYKRQIELLEADNNNLRRHNELLEEKVQDLRKGNGKAS